MLLRYDPCSVLALLLLLLYLGSSMTASHAGLRSLGLRLSGVSLLAAGGWLGVQHEPVQPADWLQLTIDAILVAGFVLSLSWIVFTVLLIVWSATFGPVWSATRSALDEERKRREEEERLRIERERLPVAEPTEERPPQPPPPSREQLTKEARDRFEARLRLLENAGLDEIELTAAREAAKKKYLRELDQILQ